MYDKMIQVNMMHYVHMIEVEMIHVKNTQLNNMVQEAMKIIHMIVTMKFGIMTIYEN